MHLRPLRTALLMRFLRRLRDARSGVAMTEFALAAPFLMVLGAYGLETANLALVHLRMSQISANLADTASRVGENSPTALKKIRESDIVDAFEAVRLQQGNTTLTTNGRIILSSLEQNANGGQWIHWQRCLGKKNVASTYGNADDGAVGKTAILGMGDTGNKITAPTNSAVMFVEIIYDYQPLISNKLLGTKQVKTKAAFLVRDKRDLTNANNPAPAAGTTAMTCNLFTT
jgi:Flp pilus assembly protein TadG